MFSFIFKMSSWKKLLLGIILGLATGAVLGEKAAPLSYLGVIFMNAIKMVIVPMVFFTIIYGATNIEGAGSIGKISIKAGIAFIITAMFAACLGLTVGYFMQPGIACDKYSIVHAMNALNASGGGADNLEAAKSPMEIFMNLIPTNIFAAFKDGHILQIIVFAFFTGVVLNIQRESCAGLIKTLHDIAYVFFKMIEIIMKLAPIGVFGYLAALIGLEGFGILGTLTKLIVCVGIACLLQYLIFGGMILVWGRMSPIPFYKKVWEAQLIAFSTSSSKATLVPLMNIMENQMGVSKQSSRFVLPLSAALNMDGGAIYHSICALFFAQLLGVQLGIAEYVTLILMSTIASIGGAGIPGGVLLFLGMVLQSVGLPMEGVLIIATVDRVLDMMTTVINVTGDACITLLIDKSQKSLNVEKYLGDEVKTQKR